MPVRANAESWWNAKWVGIVIGFLKNNATPILLLCISLAVNMAVLSDYRESPFSKVPEWDANLYWKWAQRIVAGDWVGTTIFHQAPLYPYFLSILLLVFGKHLVSVYIVQAILGTLSVVLVYSITKDLARSKCAGIGSALLFAFYGLQVFYNTKILSECLSVFLLLLSTRLLLCNAFSAKRASAAGIVFGLLFIAKPHFMLAMPVVIPYLFLKFLKGKKDNLRRSLAAVVLFLLPVTAIVGSVTVRNFLVGKDFVLISSNGGENFFIGNNEKGNGTYALVAGISPDIEYQNEDVNAVAESRTGHRMKRSEASSYWFHQGMSFIIHNPMKFMALEWIKFKYMFSGAERSTMYYMYFEKQNITGSLHIPFVNFYLLFPFFFAGFFVAVAHWRTFILPFVFLSANMLNILLFFYDTRFMLLSMPYWAVFGGLAIGHIGKILKNDGFPKALKQPCIIALLLCAGLSCFIYTCDMKVKKPDWHMHMTLGEIYLDLNDLDAALSAYTQSSYLKQDDWMPVFGVSKVHFRKGNKDVAAQLYNKAFPNLNADFKRLILRDKDLDPIRQYIKEGKAAGLDSLPD